MHGCAIGFDFDHTLGIDNKLEVTAFMDLAQRIAASSQQVFDRERALIAITREIAHYRSGRCTIDEAVALAFEDALDEEAGNRTNVEEFRWLAMELAPRHVQALPGVGDLLRALDTSGLPYAILTNGWNPLQQRKADCIGFQKPVFVSDDLGVRKPNVHAFNVLRDHFGMPADRIWYVGDDPLVDVVGALGAGMRSVWCDWEARKFPTDIPAPTAIVTDIFDVLHLVDA